MATALARPVATAPQHHLDAYLAANSAKSLLRFLTCGSVDDGKSTLIGRLLYDSHAVFDDQLAVLASDSRKSGTQGDALDLALLVDGLAAEREQGITIDVAYRYFATDKRKFIVADTPGHEQYTRNMVTGASTADLAVVLVDASKGVLTQTRRHSTLVHLLGIRHVVLAVNKMDLVDYDEARFDAIVTDYRAFATEAGMGSVVAIPMSGLTGDNVTDPTRMMPWYRGPSLLAHLEVVPVVEPSIQRTPFRMAVQWVNRPHPGFRGYAGTIASGTVRPGDAIAILPSGAEARVDRIVTFDGDLSVAAAGQSVTLTLADEVDCSRGDVIGSGGEAVETAQSLRATLVWMTQEPLVIGRAYHLKIGAQTVSAAVIAVENALNIDTGAYEPSRPLYLNEIGGCRIELDRAIAAVPYATNRELGGFILVDKVTHATVAAGMIRSLAAGVRTWGSPAAAVNSHILWVDAHSDAARTALARKVRDRLEATGHPVVLLDTASLREGLSRDLDASAEHHAEHLRRTRELAKLIGEAGIHVVIDIDAAANEAYPGRSVDGIDDEGSSTQSWTI